MLHATVLYAFYCSGEDGEPVGFQAHQLSSDDLALQTAGALMQRTPDVHQIAVWSGARPVLTLTRPASPPFSIGT
ncbi:hypothetical protein [Phenylobacterium sp.]|jgi:hypothetical protein|uniref:hypothetical protein n=1 Tax=Phenylobacterium sp. TaxID=1871053 RepID=UPI002F947756